MMMQALARWDSFLIGRGEDVTGQVEADRGIVSCCPCTRLHPSEFGGFGWNIGEILGFERIWGTEVPLGCPSDTDPEVC